MTSCDVAVVGAGPAGSTAARLLASRGHRVTLLDRKTFPREKVCGDALIPDALAALARAGVLPEVTARGRSHASLEAVSASGLSVVLPVRCITLRRLELDAILADAALEAGATFRGGEVRAIEEDASGVTLRAGGETVRARAAVVATGAIATLLPVPAGPPTAVALRQYVRSETGPDRLFVVFHRSVLPGYGWIFPMPDGWFNVGCGLFLGDARARGTNLRRLYERFVAAYAPAHALLEGALETTRLAGAPLRCGLEGTAAAARGRIVAAGEAIGATYSLTGEGIGKAMETGERAAEALDVALREDRFASLSRLGPGLWRDLGPRYAGYAAGQRWMARPLVSDLLARCARRSASLRSTLAGILEETADPARVLSPWGILRSLL